MFSFVGTLLISVLALLVVYFYNTYTYWKRRGVLYETPIPPFGNVKGIGKTHHMRDINQRLYNKFKGKALFCGTYMLIAKEVLILDLDLVKQIIIKDFSSFHDRNTFHNVKDDPLSGHLVNLEGDHWRAMRTKLTPVFTSAKMKYMFSTIVQVGDNLTDTMRQVITEAANDNIIEMQDLCERFHIDVIGNCAFGVECNSLKHPQAEFRMKGRFATRHPAIVQMFMVTCPNLARKLRMKFFTDSVTDFFTNIVKQTVEYRLENNIKRNDFMDLLIDMKAKNEEAAKKLKGIDLTQGLTVEQMAAQAFVFFVAGFETSSTTMSFCLYELAKHLEVQEKLRKEILDTLEESNTELTYESMNSMLYLEQVLAETLRLYPPFSRLIRKTKNDYQVAKSSYVIEKNTAVTIPVAAIHYDPEYYENPTEFRPSRFEPAEMERRHPMSYLPFGDGPRSCIGARFAKMQLKIGLISVLKHYRFECCPLTEIPIEFDKKHLLINPKNGIHLKVTPL